MTVLAAHNERLELAGLDRVRYFLPVGICGYLCAMCAALIVTAGFLSSIENAVAVAATGLFGLSMSGGLGYLFWRTQRRDLEYDRVETTGDAAANYDAVRQAMQGLGWKIVTEQSGRLLEARTRVTLLEAGERVVVQFRGQEVLVASICEPSVGFSLVGRRHCAEHREQVRTALTGSEAPSHAGK